MTDIKKLTEAIIQFRDKRDWQQFHNPKDVALSLVLEVAELLEHFQWKTQKEIDQYIESHKQAISDELADVLYWVLLMSHDLDINIEETLLLKIKANEARYPINKSKGRYTKYTEL